MMMTAMMMMMMVMFSASWKDGAIMHLHKSCGKHERVKENKYLDKVFVTEARVGSFFVCSCVLY